jgi:hypothetical protein
MWTQYRIDRGKKKTKKSFGSWHFQGGRKNWLPPCIAGLCVCLLGGSWVLSFLGNVMGTLSSRDNEQISFYILDRESASQFSFPPSVVMRYDTHNSEPISKRKYAQNVVVFPCWQFGLVPQQKVANTHFRMSNKSPHNREVKKTPKKNNKSCVLCS